MGTTEAVQRRRVSALDALARQDSPLYELIRRAMEEQSHEEEKKREAVHRTGLETVFEASGGAIFIPITFTSRKNGISALQFTLTDRQLRFIARHVDQPWFNRAIRPDFWQCYACGWTPHPVEVQPQGQKTRTEDACYEWFAGLHPKTRQWLVDLAIQMNLSLIEELNRGIEQGLREMRAEKKKREEERRKEEQALIDMLLAAEEGEPEKVKTKRLNARTLQRFVRKW